METKRKLKLIVNIGIYLILIPLTVILGVTVFKDRQYIAVSVILAVLVLLGFLFAYERKKTTVREMTVITVMIAFSVIGRLIFAGVPAFKPITAIVVISGIAFGYEAGFMVGALSALLSNFYFGQGPWTPFQMLSWGIIGLVAGFIFKRDKMPYMPALILYGLISGIIFSMIMDIWTVVSIDGIFNAERYAAALGAGLPFMIIYAVSNVVFLIILTKPMLRQIARIKVKYGIFDT